MWQFSKSFEFGSFLNHLNVAAFLNNLNEAPANNLNVTAFRQVLEPLRQDCLFCIVDLKSKR